MLPRAISVDVHENAIGGLPLTAVTRNRVAEVAAGTTSLTKMAGQLAQTNNPGLVVAGVVGKSAGGSTVTTSVRTGLSFQNSAWAGTK